MKGKPVVAFLSLISVWLFGAVPAAQARSGVTYTVLVTKDGKPLKDVPVQLDYKLMGSRSTNNTSPGQQRLDSGGKAFFRDGANPAMSSYVVQEFIITLYGSRKYKPTKVTRAGENSWGITLRLQSDTPASGTPTRDVPARRPRNEYSPPANDPVVFERKYVIESPRDIAPGKIGQGISDDYVFEIRDPRGSKLGYIFMHIGLVSEGSGSVLVSANYKAFTSDNPKVYKVIGGVDAGRYNSFNETDTMLELRMCWHSGKHPHQVANNGFGQPLVYQGSTTCSSDFVLNRFPLKLEFLPMSVSGSPVLGAWDLWYLANGGAVKFTIRVTRIDEPVFETTISPQPTSTQSTTQSPSPVPEQSGPQCRQCGRDVGKDDKFCRNCGAGLLQICSNCKKELPPDARFCPHCGRKTPFAAAAEQRASGTADGITVDLGNGVKMELVWIRPGVFKMGSPAGEKDRGSDEGPVHEVEISKGFWMGKYEVTQEQWQAVMGGNPSYYKGGRHPVGRVSWDDATEFCRKASRKTGKTIRLPTEAEWEYACRAGTTTKFSFGDNDDHLGDYAWYGPNADGKTHPVGQKKPNPWGLFDMRGNAYEWCSDWHSDDYYRISRRKDPQGPHTGKHRVVRGGGWGNAILAYRCRSADRDWCPPGHGGVGQGFRVVMEGSRDK